MRPTSTKKKLTKLADISPDFKLGVVVKLDTNGAVFEIMNLKTRSVTAKINCDDVKLPKSYSLYTSTVSSSKRIKAKFSSCGNYLLVGVSHFNGIPTQYTRIYDIHSLAEIDKVAGTSCGFYEYHNGAFSDDGKFLLRKNSDDSFSLINLHERSTVTTHKIAAAIEMAYYSPQNKYLFVAFNTKNAYIVDTKTGEIVENINSSIVFPMVRFSDDGDSYVIIQGSSWELVTPVESRVPKSGKKETVLAFSSSLAVTLSKDNDLTFCDYRNNLRLKKSPKLFWHPSVTDSDYTITSTTLSPNDRYLAVIFRTSAYQSGDWYKTVVYDTSDWTELFSADDYSYCMFSEDSRYLILQGNHLITVLSTSSWDRIAVHECEENKMEFQVVQAINSATGQLLVTNGYESWIKDFSEALNNPEDGASVSEVLGM